MIAFLFWSLVCFIALMFGGGIAAFLAFNIMWKAVVVSMSCGLLLLWLRR